MKINTDIKSVLLLGSGALKIGEAGEFDYSGTQAIKALKEEGNRVILVNPNVATIQTSEGLADKNYFLPITPHYVEEIIKKEKPDGILLSFGGQTALNCGLELSKYGILNKYNIQVLGTPIDAIQATEDRKLFTTRLKNIGLITAKGKIISTISEGVVFGQSLGFPVMLRAGFALGGSGSGIARSPQELKVLLTNALATTSQVIVEECLWGWKELEYEVVRDRQDNCITVCNMENFDPVGIHTGESIVVAPSQTLNDQEYYSLRQAAIDAIREFKIIGECNIQFALHPQSGDIRVIEVNARLSRSSALASKATGYPLAYVAAKLALGKTLPELANKVTQKTSAYFEPSLDYVVVKIPRWDLDKFTHVTNIIGSEMKSVGEVMSIGRTFEEALQKAVRMLSEGYDGVTGGFGKHIPKKELLRRLEQPDAKRLYTLTAALQAKITIDSLQKLTGIDSWFLEKLKNIVEGYEKLMVHGKWFMVNSKKQNGMPSTSSGNMYGLRQAQAIVFSERVNESKGDLKRLPSINSGNIEVLRDAKKFGFSDKQIAKVWRMDEMELRKMRLKYGITPVVKHIDTMAGEFPALTNYLYTTYNATQSDHIPLKSSKKAIVLGCGPYAIGTSVEFDWCAVNSVNTLRKSGYTAIIINCNPETVSTDYDISDYLYFEELTLERVLDIYDIEQAPLVVSMGGQIPNNLALKLDPLSIPILGTTAKNIYRAEDRKTFSALCDTLHIDQPQWTEVRSMKQALEFCRRLGYPVLVRPSFVLSGKAMSVIEAEELLQEYLEGIELDIKEYPLVLSKFVENAREYDFDGVAQNGEIVVSAVSEHIELAGVHSGDATMVLPAQDISMIENQEIGEIAAKIAKSLAVSGPFNIQFLVKDNRVSVIECNLRASRSIAFVSKVLKVNFITLATKILLGQQVISHILKPLEYVAVKAPQFSFLKLRGSDPILTVEMNSTGEVAGFGNSIEEAYLKAIGATGMDYPTKKSAYISIGGARSKLQFLSTVQKLAKVGYTIYTSIGTGLFLREHNILAETVHKIYEGAHPNVLDLLKKKTVDFAIVTPENASESKRGRLAKSFSDGYIMRRAAVDLGIPIQTNIQTAALYIDSILKYTPETLTIQSWQEYR